MRPFVELALSTRSGLSSHVVISAAREALPGYSITLSAVARSNCGTVRPSALAVLRLITSSKVAITISGQSCLPSRNLDAEFVVFHRTITERNARILYRGTDVARYHELKALAERD